MRLSISTNLWPYEMRRETIHYIHFFKCTERGGQRRRWSDDYEIRREYTSGPRNVMIEASSLFGEFLV